MRLTIALLAAALAALLAIPAWAETLPARPQAEACVAAQVSIADLQALVASGTPVAGTPAPAANLDDATKSAIVSTIEDSIACTNANQPLRALAFFTDRYLVHRFTGPGKDDLGHLGVAVTRSPSPAAEQDRLALISVENFALMPDGRVSAVVTTANRDQTFVDTLIFANAGGRWLIDEIVSETPAPGTPVT